MQAGELLTIFMTKSLKNTLKSRPS